MTPNYNEELRAKIIEVSNRSTTGLADVLRAIEKTEENIELGAIANGKLLFVWDKESHNEFYYWNLAADLDGQTDEVKEFLWKIICSPK